MAERRANSGCEGLPTLHTGIDIDSRIQNKGGIPRHFVGFGDEEETIDVHG